MTGDLFINGNDAWATWKVAMGDGFLETIMLPAGTKAFVENESRLENGKQVIYNNPKVDSREFTVTFNIHGDTKEEYLTNYQGFVSELQKGKVVVRIPAINTTYNLTYTKSSSFALSLDRLNSKLSVKFEEPNPGNRE